MAQSTGCQECLYFNREGNIKPKECMPNCGISDCSGQLGVSRGLSIAPKNEKDSHDKEASCPASAYCRGKWDLIQAQVRHFSRKKVDLWATS